MDSGAVEPAAPLIKVWDLDKTDKTSGHPLCTRISRASAVPGRNHVGGAAGQVTCIAVHEGLQHMVLGFADGTVVLFKGDVTKDRHSKPKVSGEVVVAAIGEVGGGDWGGRWWRLGR